MRVGRVGVLVEGVGDGPRLVGDLAKSVLAVEALAAGEEPDVRSALRHVAPW